MHDMCLMYIDFPRLGIGTGLACYSFGESLTGLLTEGEAVSGPVSLLSQADLMIAQPTSPCFAASRLDTMR